MHLTMNYSEPKEQDCSRLMDFLPVPSSFFHQGPGLLPSSTPVSALNRPSTSTASSSWPLQQRQPKPFPSLSPEVPGDCNIDIDSATTLSLMSEALDIVESQLFGDYSSDPLDCEQWNSLETTRIAIRSNGTRRNNDSHFDDRSTATGDGDRNRKKTRTCRSPQ
jgi:hypothetical protein